MVDFTARNAVVVTPHDTNANPAKRIYVGGTGAITCRPRGNSADVLVSGIPAGTVLPIEVSHIRATGTTATLIVALN